MANEIDLCGENGLINQINSAQLQINTYIALGKNAINAVEDAIDNVKTIANTLKSDPNTVLRTIQQDVLGIITADSLANPTSASAKLLEIYQAYESGGPAIQRIIDNVQQFIDDPLNTPLDVCNDIPNVKLLGDKVVEVVSAAITPAPDASPIEIRDEVITEHEEILTVEGTKSEEDIKTQPEQEIKTSPKYPTPDVSNDIMLAGRLPPGRVIGPGAAHEAAISHTRPKPVVTEVPVSNVPKSASVPSGAPVSTPTSKEWGTPKITSAFGPRWGSTHKGVDIGGKKGHPILATAAGTVTISAVDAAGYGNWIEIDHGGGKKTRYGHLDFRMVKAGETVKEGQQIGTLGNTGRSTGPHLHYEIRQGSTPVDPGTTALAAVDLSKWISPSGATVMVASAPASPNSAKQTQTIVASNPNIANPFQDGKQYTAVEFTPSKYATNIAKQINTLDPSVRERFASAIKDYLANNFKDGRDINVTEAYRSPARSAALAKSGIRAAPAGASWHNYGAAADVAIYVNGEWDQGTKSTQEYVGKVRASLSKFGLTNDLGGDCGHCYIASLGASVPSTLKTGQTTVASLVGSSRTA